MPGKNPCSYIRSRSPASPPSPHPARLRTLSSEPGGARGRPRRAGQKDGGVPRPAPARGLPPASLRGRSPASAAPRQRGAGGMRRSAEPPPHRPPGGGSSPGYLKRGPGCRGRRAACCGLPCPAASSAGARALPGEGLSRLRLRQGGTAPVRQHRRGSERHRQLPPARHPQSPPALPSLGCGKPSISNGGWGRQPPRTAPPLARAAAALGGEEESQQGGRFPAGYLFLPLSLKFPAERAGWHLRPPPASRRVRGAGRPWRARRRTPARRRST